ncbi:MAG TPA: type I polyketide synthase, partial [Burkholderiaceae bacterium]|nr:type I polyketide synthase [Burkholderiaceae bacterium]
MTRRVAIVGASFRFPQTNAARFWEDLLAGRNLITTVDPNRWSADAFLHPKRKHPGTTYTFAAGSLGDVTGFDADFFGISPREASLMDPQQRLLLELSWEVLENAAIKPSTLRGSACGVFIGIATADYSYRFADDLASVDSSFATGNTASIAANRLSYVYDLRGPSMAIDTACSSALVAFHQACRSIASGECKQALVGGVSLHLHPFGFISFSKASMLSRQGRCRVFDASGDGYVRSEGGGLFLLKDYDLALADGNPILAVVAHSAVNTDGRKSGLTVPNAMAQCVLLEQAYASAGVDPLQIDYIEAHGTGTAVGDPIETQALGEALGSRRPKGHPLLIGSVKSNLGHLEAASAVAGLVKALNCLRYRTVPATIGIETLNPHIPFGEWNLEVVTANRALRPSGKLVIGINSFGFGGANAHAILESHENHSSAAPRIARGSELPILVSGKTPSALNCAARELANCISNQPEKRLYDIADQTIRGREWHEHRALVFASTPQLGAEALRKFADSAPEAAGIESGTRLVAACGAAFVYSGNGSQWAGMGKGLLGDPVFRKAVREVDKLFAAYADFSLEAELLGANGKDRYELTEVAQPALFALQVGITQMLRQRGVMPMAVVGHSVGEVAAAWAAGALPLATAVQVIFHRSRLQGTTKGAGRMMAVSLGEQAARELLNELGLSASLCLAGVNSRKGVTIAGGREALLQLQRALAQRAINHKPLDLDYAFHSPAMEGIASQVRESLAGIDPAQSQIAFFSTVTGGLLDGHELGSDYWWRNIREPVLFQKALSDMIGEGINIFLEIGPHAILRGYIGDCFLDAGVEGRIIDTGKRGDDSPQRIWSACSQATIAGASVDWNQLFPWRGQPFELPNYPWQRQRYWHSVSSESLGLLNQYKVHPLLGHRLPHHDLTWENQLDTTGQPVLADHVVGEATVFPGSGFAELALAAAFASHSGEVAEAEDLEIRAPLTLSDERAKVLRLSIDAQDGSLTIRAREFTSGDAWTTHAVGRVLREPRNVRLGQALLNLPTRQPDFTGHSHEILTKAAGLGYGPAFQAIDHGWVDGACAVALFQMPLAVQAELGKYHLHPALLDCAFQLTIQLLKDEASLLEGWAFVPTRIGHITCRGRALTPRFARSTLISRSPHSITATFTLFDQELRPIAQVEEVRFRSIRLQKKSAADDLQYLRYQGIPKPTSMGSDATACIPFERVRDAMEQAVRQCEQDGNHRRYTEEVDPLLDSLCAHFTVEALREVADCSSNSLEATVAQVSLDAAPFLRQLLSRAQEDGLLVDADPESSVSASKHGQPRAQDIWNSLIKDYPDYFAVVHAVGRVGMHLGALFEGSQNLGELSPTDSSLGPLMRQMLGANATTIIGKSLRDLTTMGLVDLPEGKRLGVIEISEGEPVFATEICTALDFDRGDYIFASTANATIEAARRFQEKFPAINLACIESDLGAKETVQTSSAMAQLAIVTLDFQSTGDAARAINYARSRLVPGGSMVVIGFHPSRWVDFVYGSRTGLGNDTAQHNLLSRQQPISYWREQLTKLGLATITQREFAAASNCGPYLLVAQFDRRGTGSAQFAPGSPSNWLIVADEGSNSAKLRTHLADRLTVRGDRVVQLESAGTTELPALLRQTIAQYGSVNGIAYLSGLDGLARDSDAALLLQTQVERCTTAAAIVRTCVDTKTNTTCWLVTSGAAGDLLPTREACEGVEPTSAVAAAALWGFGRTLANEASNVVVRLLDLENVSDAKTASEALEREFLHQDSEQEVVITAAGERFVPRLRLAPRPDTRPQRAAKPQRDESVHLGFAVPGQLRNLRWEARARRAPGPLEVE